jgi:acetyltransferase
VKSGRTAAGAKAAASHTGSLAGSEAVYDALFQQSGVLRAESIEELFNFAAAFLGKKIPNGNRVAIVTNAGGPGIVATDMTITSGLQLAHFSEETVEALASHLPSTANLHNPVDVIGDASQDRYENALGAVIRDEDVDGALVILTPQSMTNALGTAEAIVRIVRRTHKPILCCFMGIVDVSAGVKYLQENGIPVFMFPEQAAIAYGAIYRYSQWLNRQILAQYELKYDRERANEVIRRAMRAGRSNLTEMEGNELLSCYGFEVLPSFIATSREEAIDYFESMASPVALKIVSPQILHKSDAGGVLLNLRDRASVGSAYDRIVEGALRYAPDAVIEGVLVQRMAQQGQEVILGMSRYSGFGPLLMFGLGGVFVEVFKDVVFRIAPVGRNEARRMIKGIKGHVLMEGFRGKPEVDVQNLEKAVVCLSELALNHPEIKEMDINPLMAYEKGKGCVVADCRVILDSPGTKG